MKQHLINLEKIRSGSKREIYWAPKIDKGWHKMNVWDVITRTENTSVMLFTNNIDSYIY